MRRWLNNFVLQELKLIDNAMGSGHVLVYAFDLFIELYEAEGFGRREAAELILENNLFGLEIDKRAYQLAYFAILMKGREYSRRILQKNIHLNLYQFENSSNISEEYYNRIKELSTLSAIDFSKELSNFQDKIAKFQHATEIGSVIDVSNITPDDIKELRQFINVFDEFVNMDILYLIPETHERLNNVLDIMEVMVNKYAAVVTNPPYLNKMSNLLGDYVVKNYKDVKTDMFSVFIKMNSNLLVKDGYAGFMTPFVWMFIKSYEQLRNYLIQNKSISSLIQMEYSAFEEATVPVCCFTIKNSSTEPIGNYFKLSDFRGGMKIQEEKVLEGIQDPSVDYFYQTNQQNFEKIPGSPISFWVSETISSLFTILPLLQEIAAPKSGLATGNNNLFQKRWFEINFKTIGFGYYSTVQTKDGIHKWFPENSGGEYRKWYPANEYVVNWKDNGESIKTYRNEKGKLGARAQNTQFYFKEGVTWNKLSSSKFGVRFKESGFIFDDTSRSLFANDTEDTIFLTGYLCSVIVFNLLKILNPTMSFTNNDLARIPVDMSLSNNSSINGKIKSNIELVKKFDSEFEEFWSFKRHPLI